MSTLSEELAHLTDGEDVFVPYAIVGHYRRDDPAASPVVTTLVGTGPAHPWHGRPTAVVKVADGRTWIVAVDRLAHARSCATCEPLWERLDAVLDEIPAGAMLSAIAPVNTSQGEAFLLVNAEDMDHAEDVDDEDDAA